MMSDDLYCKVYLDGVSDLNVIKTLLVEAVGSPIEGRTMQTSELLIDIFDNRSAGPPASLDDFVRWPFYLEIEPRNNDDAELDSFLEKLAEVLKIIVGKGLRAIPSCAFEERLAIALASDP